MPDEIAFKCEDSMWQMMAEEGVTGIPAKPFDMRRHDMTDDRIVRLSWGKARRVFGVVSFAPPDDDGRLRRNPDQSGHRLTVWEPEVESITFENKETGETLIRRYLGMQFEQWAPGWCFLLIGERVTTA